LAEAKRLAISQATRALANHVRVARNPSSPAEFMPTTLLGASISAAVMAIPKLDAETVDLDLVVCTSAAHNLAVAAETRQIPRIILRNTATIACVLSRSPMAGADRCATETRRDRHIP
jgi:hypothetical protein